MFSRGVALFVAALLLRTAHSKELKLPHPQSFETIKEDGYGKGELKIQDPESNINPVPGSRAGFVAGSGSVDSKSGLGKLPALGWNSWNAYDCNITEEKFLKAAEYIVKLGLKDAGYEYVNIDDCWSTRDRDPKTHRLIPDSKKFPDGISGLADKIHGLGLKIGIYTDSGTHTCQGYPGSLGYEDIDAKTFGEWEVDYLKHDNCNIPEGWRDECDYCVFPNTTCDGNICPPDYDWKKSMSMKRYMRMKHALDNQTRPILFSLCNGGEANIQQWANLAGHSWRATGDITDQWWSVLFIIGLNAYGVDHTDFYGHSDADMLEIGNGGLNHEQERSHFALWAAMKSPLLIGTNLAKIKPSSLDVLKSKMLLAFNQDDQYGAPAKPFGWDRTFRKDSPPPYWSGRSKEGVMALMLNKDGKPKSMGFKWEESPDLQSGKTYRLIDGWHGKDYGCFTGGVNVTKVAAYDTAVLILKDDCSKDQISGQTQLQLTSS